MKGGSMRVKDYYSNHRSDEYSTPMDLFNELNNEFHFNLDPCSSKYNHKCDHYYTIEDDALSFNWGKDIIAFVNPPYSDLLNWAEKCFCEWFFNHNTIVMLVPVRTSTKWFQKYVYPYCEIRFLPKRIKFEGTKSTAPFDSMICIFYGK